MGFCFRCSEKLVCYIKRRKSYRGYKGLQGITRGYKGLPGLQGVTEGDKGLQRIIETFL